MLGVLSMAGNFMMPVMISCLGDGRRVMRIALIICLVMNVMVFSVASALPWSLLIALPLWVLAGEWGLPPCNTTSPDWLPHDAELRSL